MTQKGRDYRRDVHYAVRQVMRSGFGSRRVALSIVAFMPDARRRDLDNLLKAACDALGACGVYDDDSQISDLRIRNGGVDRLSPRLEVSISEVKGEAA